MDMQMVDLLTAIWTDINLQPVGASDPQMGRNLLNRMKQRPTIR